MASLSVEDLIREIVREEIRMLLGPRAVEYRSAGPLPPGITSREHFASECRRLQIGTKHGKEWIVDAVTWSDARTSKPAQKPAPTQLRAGSATDDLAKAGFRLLRGGK